MAIALLRVNERPKLIKKIIYKRYVVACKQGLIELLFRSILLCALLLDFPDRAVPCHIKFLRSQKVVYISCGEEHTAALTKVWCISTARCHLVFLSAAGVQW